MQMNKFNAHSTMLMRRGTSITFVSAVIGNVKYESRDAYWWSALRTRNRNPNVRQKRIKSRSDDKDDEANENVAQ